MIIGILTHVAVFVAGVVVGRALVLWFLARGAESGVQELEGCRHVSHEKMKVTQFGDAEPYYLCMICGEKVPTSALFEKR